MASPKMVWALSKMAVVLRGNAISSHNECSHQRQWTESQPALMLTRLEWTGMPFKSDQMISVGYWRRKAKQFDICQTQGK
jgi:hypothetical protein